MAIILPSGFNILNNEPVDARITLADQTARYALSSANVYEGLIVFQQDSNTVWVLTDTVNVGNENGWTQLQIGSVSSNLPSGVVSGSSQLTGSLVDLISTQTISGTKTFNNINVNGTASFAFIQSATGSSTSIGEAVIILNESTPSSNFAGIKVVDSGSTFTTASFVYDGLNNNWVFEKSGGDVSGSSLTIFGPVSNNGLGTEVGLTENRIPKSVTNQGHHIGDSNITDTGTLITLGSNSVVNGTFYATGTTLVSSSAQVIGILSSLNTYTGSNDTTNTTQNSRLDQLSIASGSAISRLSTLEVETANLESFSGSALTRLTNLETTSASLLIETANLESFTSSINTTIKSKLDADGVISGSSQITAGSTTNFATDVKTRLNAETVVSGSSQINVSSTTGDIELGTRTSGNYVAVISGSANQITVAGSGLESAVVTLSLPQNIHTSANPQFNSLGIGTTASTTAGEIRATGDITAFYSSDIRLKENIQPIQNALEKVESISGNTYNWKEGYEEIHSHKGNDVGVIAQEIEQILPQIVTNRDNGYKAVQYEKIIPLLIEAIKELSARVNSLENK